MSPPLEERRAGISFPSLCREGSSVVCVMCLAIARMFFSFYRKQWENAQRTLRRCVQTSSCATATCTTATLSRRVLSTAHVPPVG